MVLAQAPPQSYPVKGENPAKDEGWLPGGFSHHPLHGLDPPRARAKPKVRSQKPADTLIEQRKHYLALFFENGQVQLKSSASLRHCEKQIISASLIDQFQDAVNIAEAESRALSAVSHTGSETTQEQDASLMVIDTTVGTISPFPFRRPKKRARANTESSSMSHSIERGSKTARVQTVQDGVRKMIQFEIGDTAQAERWIIEAFEAVQQVTCRLIAKLWIKKIEPKKQSAHPYNGGLPKTDPKDPERTKPPYWPPDIPHKEPDHIQKNQRITLLTHLVMNTPYDQLVPKDKVGDEIGAAQLQAQTEERKNDIPPEKYEILQEIFRVRKLMEMFKDGGTDGSLVVSVLDCSKTTRLDQGETEEDIEDDAPAHSDALDEEAEETEQAEPTMLTPTSSTMPSPVEQQRMQCQNNANNSASSSFSAQAGDVRNNHQPLRQQVRPYDDSFEPSMAGEMMERSAANAMAYSQPGFNQPTYSQLQISQPQFQQQSMHATIEHDTTRWAEYNNSDAFNHVSHMGAPVQAEPVIADYAMYSGAHCTSMAPITHGLPCAEDFYQQQARMNQMQRQIHHHHDLVPQLASQPPREIPYRTASGQSTQHMPVSRHNSYDQAIMQNSFFTHM